MQLLNQGITDRLVITARLGLTPRQLSDCFRRLRLSGAYQGKAFPQKTKVVARVRIREKLTNNDKSQNLIEMYRDLKALGTKKDMKWPWYGDHECKFR